MADYFDREAEDASEDESFDEETGDIKKKSNGKPTRSRPKDDVMDSSDEEDTENEEEQLKKVQEDFIVDDEEEEEEDADLPGEPRKRRKKRRRSKREEDDEDIDDSDMELMAENMGLERNDNQHKLKRFKRGRVEEPSRRKEAELEDMFDDEPMDDIDQFDDDDGIEHIQRSRKRHEGGAMDMMDDNLSDFIEDDPFSDEEEGGERDRDDNRPSKARRPINIGGELPAEYATAAVNENMLEVFGDGTEYDWALVTKQDEDEMEQDQVVDLKDIFEPSELKDKMLTDEDNQIRALDIPERFQIARKPYIDIEITEEDYQEEGAWVASKIFATKRPPLSRHLRDPFFEAVKKILDFIVRENMEVPFIYHNRKDYLIHADRFHRKDAEGKDIYEVGNAERLLNQEDLWTVFDLDLKYRAFVDKRNALKKTYAMLSVSDAIFEERITDLENVEEVQDLHDYLHFQYADELKDAALLATTNGTNGIQKKRPGTTKTQFERTRKSKAYGLVKEFGLSAEQFANNAKLEQKRDFADDPSEFPNELAEMYTDEAYFTTGSEVLKAAKRMLAEEMYLNPVLRKVMRAKIFRYGVLSVRATDKGVKKIDETHAYYDFKYLKNQAAQSLIEYPARYLRMLQAEEEMLVEINIEIENKSRMMTQFDDLMKSENYSDQAEAWNEERKMVLEIAVEKLLKLMAKNFKEAIKTRCEDDLAKSCRKACLDRLDQAPYHAKGLKVGEIPRVFAVSSGNGEFGKDATMGIFMDEDGRVLEQVKYTELRDLEERQRFIEILGRRKPDVIAVGGFAVPTNRLLEDVRRVVEEENLMVTAGDGAEDVDERNLLEVLFVQDEVARLYMNSERGIVENASLPPVARYCVGLARYVQNPLLEYAALGKDISSINFHPDQQLIPEERLKSEIEQAMVDMVNLVGVDINQAAKSPYVANTVPFICGLGQRKATHVLKMIDANDGQVESRTSLVGDPENNIIQVVGPTVFTNCASFIKIEYESSESEYFDSTRVHPEDYDLGRKMASDALELDEEDVADITKNGQDPGAIVSRLVERDEQDKVNELVLEEYADELEKNFNQRKRATLETIRAELQNAYEELRNPFRRLTAEQIFTKLTGETDQTLHSGLVVPVSIRRVSDRYISARLDCGVEGNVAAEEMTDRSERDFNISPHTLFHQGQTVQAKVKSINIKTFYAELTLKESEIRNPYRKSHDKMPDEWDEEREERDRIALTVSNQEEHRSARVIKHPLFKPFNARQAEEYLAQHSRGDAVIRPSSKGQDHIAVTWKVDDGIYQHIDVLELDKENEFSVGRTLRVANKYSYSDLDDLIFNHVKSMARKVEELEQHDRFKNMPKDQVDQWLTTYTEANPKRAIYAFCLNTKKPGRFDLCFKNGLRSKCWSWEVQVVPQAFMLQQNVYPDMTALCNGFKILFTNLQQRDAQANMRNGHHRAPPPRR